MKRLLLFVHYNKDNKLSDRVVFTLEKLRPTFDTVVIISNSKLSAKNKSSLSKLSDMLILRENKGFDFAAWRDGMEKFGWPKLKKYDSLTLMNDTCHGPLRPLDEYYEKFDKRKGVDFWGATIYRSTTNGMPGTDGPVPEHIQSYFMTFKQNVVKSRVFSGFWKKVQNHTDITDVIAEYEVKLTDILTSGGFKYDSIINTTNPVFSSPHMINPAFQDPVQLLKQGFPFIKLKAITKMNFLKVKEFIKGNSSYPYGYIDVHGGAKLMKPALSLVDFMLKKAHLVFLAIGIPSVIAFSILTPPGFGGDEMAHSIRAYSISRGHIKTIDNHVPDGLKDTVELGWKKAESSPWGLQFYLNRHDLIPADRPSLEELGSTKLNSSTSTHIKLRNTDPYSPIVYAGAAIGFWISSQLDLSVHSAIILARILNAIPFFLLGSLAIYVLRKNMARWLIFTILLLPTVLSYVGTINGDPYNIASVSLFIALFIKFSTPSGKLSRKELLALATSSILLSFAKLPSILLIGLLLFMKNDNFKNTKDKWIKITLIAIVSLSIAFLSTKTGITGITGDSSTLDKVVWATSQPIESISLIGRTALEESSDYLSRAVGVMGRNGVYIHNIIIMMLYTWLVILSLSIADYSRRRGSLLLLYGTTMCFVVMTLLFLGDSENTVNKHTIFGVHGKYFTPFMFLIFYGAGTLMPFKITSNKGYVGLFTIILMSLVAISSVLTYKIALY